MTIIQSENIDSFIWPPHSPKRKCAFKGCNRAARVILFWRPSPKDPQGKDYICVFHTCELSNGVLSHYKFGVQ